MGKNGNNIHQRKDGRWEGRYKKGYKDNGTIIYGSVYGKTYAEVQEKMIIISAKKEVNESTNNELSFSELLNLWLNNNRIRYKGATENKYNYLINTHIIPHLGEEKISQLTAPKINAFLMEKSNCGRLDQSGGLSPSYVRSIMLIINSALKFAAAEQLCMPLKSPIYKPTILKKNLTILTLKQQQCLEQYILDHFDLTKGGIFISLHTGLRIGEICALSWKDIDLEDKTIHIRHTIARIKNNDSAHSVTKLIIDSPKTISSIRDIPISSSLFPILIKIKGISNSPFVISDKESFFNPRTLEYRFHRILDECKIPSINYHALRHTFATRCIEAGVDVKSLSEILGHSNVGITLNTYVHSSMELKRLQIEKFANVSNVEI